MYPIFNIRKQINDLEANEFIFMLIGCDIYLDRFYSLKRESKRHQYRTIKKYNRLSGWESNITKEEVPMTIAIQGEVFQLIVSELNFK